MLVLFRETIEVSIYALDADHAPVVEAAVRRALLDGVPGSGTAT